MGLGNSTCGVIYHLKIQWHEQKKQQFAPLAVTLNNLVLVSSFPLPLSCALV